MKERLAYLDAAKGIGMLFIMFAHIGVVCPIPMIYDVKVALFFLLSGLFFPRKTILGFKEYILSDCKRIFVPFLFFYSFSYALFYFGTVFIPGFQERTGASGILDCFTQKQYFNGPIWFLLCLFWIRVNCYFIVRYINKEWVRCLVALTVGLAGFFFGKNEINLPLTIDTALTFTPVLYLGTLITKFSLFERYTRPEYGIFSVVLYMSCLPITMPIQDSLNRYGGGYINLIYLCLALCISIVFACKFFFSNSIILAYIGRNSMWIMCTHHLIYRPVKLILDRVGVVDTYNLMAFVLTLAICCATAPLVYKYVPIIIGASKKQ